MIAAAILVMVAAAVSWVSYRSERLWVLMALRFASLMLLAWILTDPVLQFTRPVRDKPLWTILVDASQSVDAYRTDVNRITEAIAQIDTTERAIRTIRFGGESTDLDAAFAEAFSGPEPHGIVLISDGIPTSGRDPVHRVAQAGIPVHVLPIGDPTTKRDIAVVDAGFPERVPRDTDIDIPVRLTATGFAGVPVTIRLTANGSEIAAQTWIPESESDYHAPVFRIRTGEPGRIRYEIRTDALDGESTTRNNRHIAIMRVEADRIRVAHIIQELHPDVGSFHRILSDEASMVIHSHRFTVPILDSADVLLIHGWPTDAIVRSQLSEAMRRIPHVIAPLPATWAHPDLRTYYGSGPVMERLPVNERIGAHPVTDLPPVSTERSPFLFGPLNMVGDASVILRSTDGRSMTRIRRTSPRVLVLDAWGWHRWHTSPMRTESEWTARFIQQAVKWVATEETESGLTIDGLPELVREDSPVTFFARLRNSAGQPQSDADVSVRAGGRVYRMIARGDGLYEVALPPFPSGEHRIRLDASVAGEAVASIERIIESGASPVEFRNLQRNDALLKALAERSGGRLDTMDGVLETIRATTAVTRQEPVPFTARRHPAWFILLIGLLSAEWFIRRRMLKP